MTYRHFNNESTRSSVLRAVADTENEAAWNRFFDLYAGFVYSVARSRGLNDADADDVVQNVFADLARNLPTFRYDRAKGRFRSYLAGLVNWRVVDKMKSAKREADLKPNYKDAKYNLVFAQSRITDNIAEQDFFLLAWTRAVRNCLSEHTWWVLSISLFILALIGLLLFLLGRETWIRKTAFHTAWIALLFSLIAGLNAGSLHQRDTLRNEAIITQGIVNAKSSPDRSGTDLFTIHEGTKVTIRETLGEWSNVRVGSNEGWIRSSCLERI